MVFEKTYLISPLIKWISKRDYCKLIAFRYIRSIAIYFSIPLLVLSY